MPQPQSHGGHLLPGAKAHRGPQHLSPFMLGEGDGGATRHPPKPQPLIPQFPPWGNCGPFPPSVSQPGGGEGGEQEAPEPPHCPYKDSTAPELLPPSRTPGPAPHLPLYPTPPSHIPISALHHPLHPTSAPPSPDAPPSPRCPHIHTSAPHQPIPPLPPSPPLPHTIPCPPGALPHNLPESV